jgi:hypothetical protein
MNRRINTSSLPDAAAQKKTGTHREFSREFHKHWDRLVYAQVRVLNAIFQYAAVGTNASIRKRRTVGHRIDDLTYAICRSDAFAGACLWLFAIYILELALAVALVAAS